MPEKSSGSNRLGSGDGPAATRRRQALLWIGLILSVPGLAYASLGFIYFVWLEGLQQGPAAGAGLFALGALALGVLCAGIFIYCLVALIRNARSARRKGAN